MFAFMLESYYQLFTLAERPDLREQVGKLTGSYWPKFMTQNATTNTIWNCLYTDFPEYQFALLDTRTETVIGVGNSIALRYEGSLEDLPDKGWEWAFLKAYADHQAGIEPNIQSAVQIVIDRNLQGKLLSPAAVEFMRNIGKQHGFKYLIAPVRPNKKTLYPLTPMQDYITWTNEQGQPFDPWMRVHTKLGAKTIRVCPNAFRISGSVSDWELWTGMRFPQTGLYIIPDALNPITINRETNHGEYIEPNVWMAHPTE